MLNIEWVIAVTLGITFVGDLGALLYTALIIKTRIFDRFLTVRTNLTLAAEKEFRYQSFIKRKRLVLWNALFFKPLIAASGLYLTRGFINLGETTPTKVIFELVMLLFISDLSFYWLHRWMHQNRFLFKKIHFFHHRATRPIPLDYMYEHPLEIIIENLGSFLGIMILGPVSAVSLWAFGVIRVVHAVHTHSGVEFKRIPSGPISGTEPHDLHHFRLNGNYGLIFKAFDWAFKTELKAAPESRLQS